MKFFVFEGLKGSGKTTAIQGVYQRLRDDGIKTRMMRYMNETVLGKNLRVTLAHTPKIHRYVAGYLYLADREQQIQEVLIPLQGSNTVILQDRWTPSTLVYQDRLFWDKALDVDESFSADHMFWFNTPPLVAAERVAKRDGRENVPMEEYEHDRYETLYETSEKWTAVDGTLSPNEVADIVYSKIKEML